MILSNPFFTYLDEWTKHRRWDSASSLCSTLGKYILLRYELMFALMLSLKALKIYLLTSGFKIFIAPFFFLSSLSSLTIIDLSMFWGFKAGLLKLSTGTQCSMLMHSAPFCVQFYSLNFSSGCDTTIWSWLLPY